MYYKFGQRLASKHSMADSLNEGDMVSYNAVRTDPSPECQWFATALWKGKKPPSRSYVGSGEVVLCRV